VAEVAGKTQALGRPIGWWLKEADALLDATFEDALRGTGVDRRGWQVLASLAKRPTSRDDLVVSLAAFDAPSLVDAVIGGLQEKGWVEDSSAGLSLSPSGVLQQRTLATAVGAVRQKISEALPAEDYEALIILLARLVAALNRTDR
jgi:hypothetical protein